MWDFNLDEYFISSIGNMELVNYNTGRSVFLLQGSNNHLVFNNIEKDYTPVQSVQPIYSNCRGCGAPPVGYESNCKYCGRRI